VHDTNSGRMARRKIKTNKPVEYGDAEPSAFASMLGGLIEANIENSPAKRKDFDGLAARVGIWVTDIDEGVTLDFQRGSMAVHNGLQAKRDITIRAEAGTVMELSNLKIGPFGMPVYYNDVGRGVALKLLQGKLRIDGLLGNIATLNTVTRIFSVQ
jgi:SCP-2 sterol transfer family